MQRVSLALAAVLVTGLACASPRWSPWPARGEEECLAPPGAPPRPGDPARPRGGWPPPEACERIPPRPDGSLDWEAIAASLRRQAILLAPKGRRAWRCVGEPADPTFPAGVMILRDFRLPAGGPSALAVALSSYEGGLSFKGPRFLAWAGAFWFDIEPGADRVVVAPISYELYAPDGTLYERGVADGPGTASH